MSILILPADTIRYISFIVYNDEGFKDVIPFMYTCKHIYNILLSYPRLWQIVFVHSPIQKNDIRKRFIRKVYYHLPQAMADFYDFAEFTSCKSLEIGCESRYYKKNNEETDIESTDEDDDAPGDHTYNEILAPYKIDPSVASRLEKLVLMGVPNYEIANTKDFTNVKKLTIITYDDEENILAVRRKTFIRKIRHFTALESLTSNISYIPSRCFEKLTNIRELYLNNYTASNINKIIGYLPLLEKLFISDMYIEELANHKNLKYLALTVCESDNLGTWPKIHKVTIDFMKMEDYYLDILTVSTILERYPSIISIQSYPVMWISNKKGYSDIESVKKDTFLCSHIATEKELRAYLKMRLGKKYEKDAKYKCDICKATYKRRSVRKDCGHHKPFSEVYEEPEIIDVFDETTNNEVFF
jgi:hypothetical protein